MKKKTVINTNLGDIHSGHIIAVDTETDRSPHLLPDYSLVEVRVMAELIKGLNKGEIKLIACKTGTGQSRIFPDKNRYSVDNKKTTVYDSNKITISAQQRRKS